MSRGECEPGDPQGFARRDSDIFTPYRLELRESGSCMGIEFLRPLPKVVSNVFSDVDKTITAGDKPHMGAINALARMADRGARINLITGRDYDWILRVIEPAIEQSIAEQQLNYNRVMARIKMYPEIGLMSVDLRTGIASAIKEIDTHPLRDPQKRARLATFFSQAADLEKADGDKTGRQLHRNLVQDANGVRFHFPIFTDILPDKIKFPQFIWSEYKTVIGTAEVFRASNGELMEDMGERIEIATRCLREYFAYHHLDTVIAVSPVGTAINFVPVDKDGIVYDKDWIAARILREIQAELGGPSVISLEKIAGTSIGIGDGAADAKFSRPRERDIEVNVPFASVGTAAQMRDLPSEQQENMFVRPYGTAEGDGEFWGAEATEAICEQLEKGDRIKPVMSLI